MKYICSIIISALLMSACSKIEVPSPEFDVTSDRLTYKVGDTIGFKISGNAANITFYSGERGFEYSKKDEVTIEKGVPQLIFTSATAQTAQANSLQVWVSTVIDVVDQNSVTTSSNWKDITERVILATNSTSTSSGVVDLSEFAVEGKKFVLAYKYVAATRTNTTQPLWVIRSFNINNIFPDGSSAPIASLAGTQWQVFDIKNPVAKWTFTASELRMNGGTANSPDNEDYIVTPLIDLNETRERADYGLSIKNIASSSLEEYKYVYKQPGTYNITFVAFNNSIDDNKQVVKSFEITVQP